MKKIKVYSTPTCPWCKKVKEYLFKNKINFEDFDVTEDEEARKDMIEKSGQMGVPVIDIRDKIIVGFDQGAIEKAIAGDKEK
jgi:glutaredoxin 3